MFVTEKKCRKDNYCFEELNVIFVGFVSLYPGLLSKYLSASKWCRFFLIKSISYSLGLCFKKKRKGRYEM